MRGNRTKTKRCVEFNVSFLYMLLSKWQRTEDRPSSAVNSCIYLPVDLNKRLMEEASAVSVDV